MERSKIGAASVAAIVMCMGSQASAENARCGSQVTLATVVPCALQASLEVRAERDAIDAARGRYDAVSPLLPSNPTLILAGSRRTAGDQRATNWYATLSQELEIGGQRGVRRDSAQAEVDAQQKRVLIAQRDVAAAALSSFYAAVAAREQQALASRLTATTDAVAIAAHARADKGLIAPVDADVADAASVRVARSRFAADRQVGETSAALATMLGLDPSRQHVEVSGELTPLTGANSSPRAIVRHDSDSSVRPELQAFDADRRAMELRASAFRRSRVPNPTVSAFVERDGFDERVLGLGVSIPIPIPGNVGRTYIGEVAEAEALARRAATERARVLRAIRFTVATAAQDFESRRLEVEAFRPDILANAETSLRALGQEVESGRLTVRDAIVAQQALIELLQSYVAARRDWCLASVVLARAAGVALERSVP